MSKQSGKTSDTAKTNAEPASPVENYLVKDPELFALNIARMVEQAGKAASAWAEPREKGKVRDSIAEPAADMVKTFSKLTEYWLSDPRGRLKHKRGCFPATWTSGRMPFSALAGARWWKGRLSRPQ